MNTTSKTNTGVRSKIKALWVWYMRQCDKVLQAPNPMQLNKEN